MMRSKLIILYINILILTATSSLTERRNKDGTNIQHRQVKEKPEKQTQKRPEAAAGPLECSLLLNQTVRDEIQSYQSQVDQIIDLFTTRRLLKSLKGETYNMLTELTDNFGPRMTGFQALEDSIDWMLNRAIADQFDNVYTENVTSPFWVRNNETLYMVGPRRQQLAILGLGTSVGTPSEGITAEALVVTSFDDLANKSALAAGRMVVYNVPFTTYEETAPYRILGAAEAAKYGAVASLVRSLTDFSIATTHTGGQVYSEDYPQIPAAAITVEDAELLYRLQERGAVITLRLQMEAANLPDVQTRNAVLEVQGQVTPNEVVVVSGHIDSWDVGTGAMDDGGGIMIAYMAGNAMKQLGFQPRRTIRAILFTAEEQKVVGGEAYFNAHEAERENFQIMMESDLGTFNPRGIQFSGNEVATCIMEEILLLTAALNTTQLVSPADVPDLEQFQTAGVPTGSLLNDNDHYFWYHHSNGDTIDVEDQDVLDKVAALWTSVAYVLADLSFRLPSDILANATMY